MAILHDFDRRIAAGNVSTEIHFCAAKEAVLKQDLLENGARPISTISPWTQADRSRSHVDDLVAQK
jgi:hypothetical protein